jgi:hypothetical protein
MYATDVGGIPTAGCAILVCTCICYCCRGIPTDIVLYWCVHVYATDVGEFLLILCYNACSRECIKELIIP